MDPPNNLGAGPNPDSGWKKEAHAVIRDVEAHVKLISVAEHIKVSYLVSLSETLLPPPLYLISNVRITTFLL